MTLKAAALAFLASLMPLAVQAAPTLLVSRYAQCPASASPLDAKYGFLSYWTVTKTGPDHATVTIYENGPTLYDSWTGNRYTNVDTTPEHVFTFDRRGAFLRFKASNLTSGNPTASVLWPGDAKDCSDLQLTPSPAPETLYDAALKDLAKPVTSVADYRRVRQEVSDLPPLNLLPALDQNDYQAKISSAQDAANNSFAKLLDAQVKDPKNRTVLPEIYAMMTSERRLGVSENDAELLAREIRAHDMALSIAGIDPLTSAVSTDAALCHRLSLPAVRQLQSEEGKFLVFATGVAPIYWTKARANAWLASADTCQGNWAAQNFKRVLTNAWPRIQQEIKGLAWLKQKVTVMKTAKITSLADLDKVNWFQVSEQEMLQHHLSGDFINAYTNDAYDAAIKRASDAVDARFKADMAAWTAPPAILAIYCSRKFRHYGYISSNTPVGKLRDRCQAQDATATYVAVSNDLKAKYEEMAKAKPTLENIKLYNGFAIPDTYARFLPNVLSSDKVREIDTLRTSYNDKLAEKVQPVFGKLATKVSNAYSSALANKTKISPDIKKTCSFATSMDRTPAIYALQDACHSPKVAAYRKMRADMICAKTFKLAGFPFKFVDNYVAITTPLSPRQKVTFRTLLCQTPKKVGIGIKASNGWFSNGYALTRHATVDGTEVDFSARLAAPSSGGDEWTLSHPTITPGSFNTGLFDMSRSDIIGACMVNLEVCYKPK